MVIGYVQRLQTPIIARPSENLTVRLLITDTDELAWVLLLEMLGLRCQRCYLV